MASSATNGVSPEYSPRQLAARALSSMFEEAPAARPSPAVFRRRAGTSWQSASTGLEPVPQVVPAPGPNRHFYAPYPKVRPRNSLPSALNARPSAKAKQ